MEVQGSCRGMCAKKVTGTYLGMRDIEGGQCRLSIYLRNKFLSYNYIDLPM